MGEIADIVGIYGAIDDAVAEDGKRPDRREAIARLLPAYRDPETRWFDTFKRAARRQHADSPEARDIVELDDALEDLAKYPATRRMRARRLLAIAAVAQLEPELVTVEGGRAVRARAALNFGEARGDADGRQRLLEILADEGRVLEAGSPDAWWDGVVEVVVALGFATREEIGHRPCTGRLVETGNRLVTVLETNFVVDHVPFSRAIRFLDPVNWPDCNAFWCQMYPLGTTPPDVHHFDEVVAVECPAATAFWTVSAKLDFRFGSRPGIAWTSYDLTPGVPPGDVPVDKGLLLIERLGPDDTSPLRVVTSKQVCFNDAFGGQGLAMMMCALGYASVVEDLVHAAAESGDDAGTPFPPAGTQSAGPGLADGSPLAEAVKELVDHAAASVKRCVDAGLESAEKAQAGTYGADDLAKDVVSMGDRMVREGAMAVKIGLGAFTNAPAPKPEQE